MSPAASTSPISELAAGTRSFNELAAAFAAQGWRLDPLHGEALQAVHCASGARSPCYGLDEARALLDQLTGCKPDECKRFASLRATAALAGFELLRTDPADGPVRYLGSRWGAVREIGTSLDLVEGFVRVMGGRI